MLCEPVIKLLVLGTNQRNKEQKTIISLFDVHVRWAAKLSIKRKAKGKTRERERKKIEIVQILVQISGLQLRIRLENKKSCLITSNSAEDYAHIVGFFAMLTSRKTVQQGFGQKCGFSPDKWLTVKAGLKGNLVTWYILTFAFWRRSESNGNIHRLLQYINNFIYHV